MDATYTIVPYMTPPPLNPDELTPFIGLVFFLFLGACLQANAGKHPEEAFLADTSETNAPYLTLPPPVASSQKPVAKKEQRVEIPGLEDIILASLSKRTGLRTKDLVPKIRTIFPEIKKGDINSCLYKLLTKKQVLQSDDDTPLWTLKK
jgi:hypothetical protein